ncbi:hypothetical protein P152DRAFT_457664 [Eremomyces bilateralis CBS 781.70]|uniref:Uncharacterized protein n=1 Tax=Eremomyces bilateralis CBS 781.70 TaxID=1392243 RepID=A0A6G1G644_9PEZI|nr:uncharacterized protein P152DRAFT_457664 [Eremomyces bilateralis CBS 781.70]KAF1813299.1 hypothetical protein P152DRAFT_457664 [Eremomyces bilateralis CBS 781.70]
MAYASRTDRPSRTSGCTTHTLQSKPRTSTNDLTITITITRSDHHRQTQYGCMQDTSDGCPCDEKRIDVSKSK